TLSLHDALPILGGSGASRTISVTPVANGFGTATLTVTVKDADNATASDQFVVTVTSVNDAPTISDIADTSTAEDVAKTVNFTVGDVETLPGALTLSATSSDETVVPAA